ncbi:MAG: alanine--glyoxylate aminotransferase family protein [Gemmatimonadaceae bacterium]
MTASLLTEGTFFFPGPTEVRAEVLAAMTRPLIPHRGAAFESLYATLQDALKPIFGTTRPVYVSSSSATGLMEAAVRCAPEGRVLALVNGAFSARFAAITKACGHDMDVLEVPYGAVVTLEMVEHALAQQRYAAVTVAHSETSTGALQDVRGITRLAHAAGAVCLVDSVTGIGGAELRFDEWGLDFALTGSQKALALPPGLAFAAATPAFIEAARATARRGLYFDLVEFDAYGAKNQTPNTPAISLFYAAEVQLPAIVAEGLPARWARHRAMAHQTYEWVDSLAGKYGDDFGILAGPAHRTPTVTSVTIPSSFAASTLVRAVAERGFTIGNGYGKNRETTFRIGHMGDHTTERLAVCLEVCSVCIDDLMRG